MNVKNEDITTMEPNNVTFRVIDQKIFQRIAYFLELKSRNSSSESTGPCEYYSKRKSGLVKFSQVCKAARSASLPLIWSELSIHSIQDLKMAESFLTQYHVNQKGFRESCGVHVKSLRIWVDEIDEELLQDFLGRKKQRKSYGERLSRASTDGICENIEHLIKGLAPAFPNVTVMAYKFMLFPLVWKICYAIGNGCRGLKTLHIHYDALCKSIEPLSRDLYHKVSEITFDEANGKFNLADFSFDDIQEASNYSPFAFLIREKTKDYTKSQIAAIRIMEICLEGAQYNLQCVTLPNSEKFFSYPPFWPLWTWIKVNKTQDCIPNSEIVHAAWVNAFQELREIIKSLDLLTQYKWLGLLDKQKALYLGRIDVHSILIDLPYVNFNQQQRQESNSGKERMQKRLTVDIVLHFFATLTRDFALLDTIIKSKDMIGKYATND